MIPIIEFLTSTIGRYVIGGVGVLALFLAFKSHEQHKGAAKAVAKIEKATENAVKKGTAAADRSRSGGVRGGQIDPTTRND
jgi:hypothetical protein